MSVAMSGTLKRPGVISDYRLVVVGGASYLCFCATPLTQLRRLVLFWPYPLLVATQTLTGFSTADFIDYFLADTFGLVVVLATLCWVQRRVGRGRPSWIATVLLASWSWFVPLLVLESIAYVVGVVILRTGWL
jgi:hypothetical protein